MASLFVANRLAAVQDRHEKRRYEFEMLRRPHQLMGLGRSDESRTNRNFGAPIVRMGAVTSTMDVARRLERLGAAEGTTVIAALQTAGRGRSRRNWESPVSTGLYCSILLRPRIAISQLQPFAIAAGLAVCDALDPVGDVGLQLKWPNDVLHQGRKLAGILITSGITGETVESAVLGIGLNLSPDPLFPEQAISLAEIENVSIDREATPFAFIATALEQRYRLILATEAERAIDGWERRLAYLDQVVSIVDGSETIEGRLAGLAANGSLLLETSSGVKQIASGDLVRGTRLV